MKKVFSILLVFVMVFCLCACTKKSNPTETVGTSETTQPATESIPPTETIQPTTEGISGNEYFCTSVRFFNGDFKEFNVAKTVYEKLFIGSVIISEDRTQLIYTNQMGRYTASLKTKYDGSMWYDSEVSWNEKPEPYGKYKVTTTVFSFDEARGLVRMNFDLDGKKGDEYSGLYFIFMEFEIG